MDENERRKKALKFFKNTETLLVNLYARWQDEKDHEDINEYRKVIEKRVTKIGGKFVKMNKRPFGFVYKLSDATYQVIVRSNSYQYKRIA